MISLTLLPTVVLRAQGGASGSCHSDELDRNGGRLGGPSMEPNGGRQMTGVRRDGLGRRP